MKRARMTVFVFATLTLLLAGTWFLVTSSWPDGLEAVAEKLGFAGRAKALAHSPMADYRFAMFGSVVAGRIAAALLGAGICFFAAWGLGKLASRPRKPREKLTTDEHG